MDLTRGSSLNNDSSRSLCWIPVLRKLTKSVIQNCYGCKRFRATHCTNPKPVLLRGGRTEQVLLFEMVGIDYVDQQYYKVKGKMDLKAYILLISSSVSRAVHLELVSNITATEFIKHFNKLISRRRKPSTTYSDNAKTFTRLSRNSTFQRHYGAKDSTNV